MAEINDYQTGSDGIITGIQIGPREVTLSQTEYTEDEISSVENPHRNKLPFWARALTSVAGIALLGCSYQVLKDSFGSYSTTSTDDGQPTINLKLEHSSINEQFELTATSPPPLDPMSAAEATRIAAAEQIRHHFIQKTPTPTAPKLDPMSAAEATRIAAAEQIMEFFTK